MDTKRKYGPSAVCRLLLTTAFSYLAIFLIPAIVQSQDKGFIVSGAVIDSENEAPVENVNITVRNTKTGTITDQLGRFSLRITTLPFYLEFSHVSYNTKTQGFEHEPLQDLRIKLSPRSEPLQGVTITSQKIDTLFADRVYSVLDYELSERGILLLIYKANLSRSELLLKDYSGGKLADLTILPMRPLALFKDCLNEIHILSKNQAYQVSMSDGSLALYDPYDLDYFTEVMAQCKFRAGEKVFFEEYLFYDLIKKIHYVSTRDTSSHLLTTISDPAKIMFLRQNPENYALSIREHELELLGSMRGTGDDNKSLKSIRDMTVDLRFNKMAYLSKIYVPFFAMRDTIVIFNHPGNVIEFYDLSDSLIGQTRITYHLAESRDSLPGVAHLLSGSAKWQEEVYVDAIRNKAYTVFQNINGTRDLKEIDLKTGSVNFILNIPFPYVQKIRIRDGYVYFVYKSFGEMQKKKLFRQQIN